MSAGHGGRRWRALRARKLAESRYCEACGRLTDPSVKALAPELDHVDPHSLGGPPTWTNTRVLCHECNRSKGAKTIEQWKPIMLVEPYSW